MRDKRCIRETDCPWLRMRLHLAQGHRRHRINAPFVWEKKRKKDPRVCASCAHRYNRTDSTGDLTDCIFVSPFSTAFFSLPSRTTILFCLSRERIRVYLHVRVTSLINSAPAANGRHVRFARASTAQKINRAK